MEFIEMSETVRKGVDLARAGRYGEAFETFEKDASFTRVPAALSYYALALAEVEGNYERATALSLIAAEKEFYNPDIYHNLGRILLMNGQKSAALKAFRRGLKFDSTHEGLTCEVERLGVRRRPVVPFLSRHSALNRLLGRLTYRFAAAG